MGYILKAYLTKGIGDSHEEIQTMLTKCSEELGDAYEVELIVLKGGYALRKDEKIHPTSSIRKALPGSLQKVISSLHRQQMLLGLSYVFEP